MRNVKRTTLFIFAFVLLFTIKAAAVNYGIITSGHPPVKNGVLDLSEHNFLDEGILPLSGDWQFFWSQSADDLNSMSSFAPVPGTWESYKEKFSPIGFACYRITVKNCSSNQPLAIYLTSAATAYRLYVNDKLIGQNGSFGDGSVNITPQIKPQSMTFETSENFDIVIQVANSIYARGGLWFSPYIGIRSDIKAFENTIENKDIFLLGAILVICLYYFCHYQFNRNRKEYLYFALICFVVVVRISVYGSYLAQSLIPKLPYKAIVIMVYNTVYWVSCLYLEMVSVTFFPKERTLIRKIVVFYTVILSVLSVLLPIKVLTAFAPFFEFIAFIIFLYTIYIILKACISKMTGSRILLVGTLIVFGSLIYDLLYHKNYVSNYFGPVSPISYLVLALLVAILLSKRYSETYREVKTLNIELTKMNSLKTQVYETQLALLQSQIKPHFMFNTLNVIASLCKIDSEKAENLIVDLSNLLRSSYNFNKLPKLIPLSEEMNYVQSYINIENARFVDKLEVCLENHVSENFLLPPLILQPIVENAIRHGIRKKSGKGKLSIVIDEDLDSYIIKVHDDGLGMSKERICEVLDNKLSGKNGIGIPNVNQRLKEYYGTSLNIESVPNVGTTVTMIFPKGGAENKGYIN